MSDPDDKSTADLWLLNSCTVKSPAEDHFRNEIKMAKDSGKFLVLAGCVPQGQPRADYIQVCHSSEVSQKYLCTMLKFIKENIRKKSS